MASFIARKNSRVDMLVSRREKEISDSIILYKTGVQNDKSSDKFSCACPWFLSINQTYTPDPRIIINFFRLKRNRIAAIRRINLFLFERKEKNFCPSYLLRLLFRLTRKIFTNIFLEWICKIFRIHVCTKMYREQPFLVRGLLVFL